MAEPFDPYRAWLGIAPSQQPPDHYRLLGVARFTPDPDAISRAAELQIARLQPHLAGPHAAEAQRLIQEISAARTCLLTPQQRTAYDRMLGQHVAATAGSQAAPRGGSTAAGGGPAALGAGIEPERAATFREPTGGRMPPGPKAEREVAPAVWWGVALAGPLLVISALIWKHYAARESSEAPETSPSVAVAQQEEQGAAPPAGQKPTNGSIAAGATGGLSASGNTTRVDKVPVAPSASEPAVEAPAAGPVSPAVPLARPLSPSRVPATKLGPTKSSLAATKLGSPRTGTSKSPQAEAASGPSTPSAREGRVSLASAAKPEQPAGAAKEESGLTALAPPPAIETSEQVDPILSEAWDLAQSRQEKSARERLAKASKLSPSDIRPEFLLGLLAALSTPHDFNAVEKHFAECVKRQPEHVPSLNNLALAEVRSGKHRQAIRHWTSALAATPVPEEVVHNVKRYRRLTELGRIKMEPAVRRLLDELYSSAFSTASEEPAPAPTKSRERPSSAGKPSSSDRVWRYMPFSSTGAAVGWSKAKDYEDPACMVCDGRGKVRCTAQGCVHGLVKQVKPYVTPPVRNPLNPYDRRRHVEPVMAAVPCKTCKGTGLMDCPHCQGGKSKE